MSNPDKPAVVTTRWWWVRHAPVRSDGGNIYGQKDIACDTSDRVVRGGGKNPAARCGLGCEQPQAHASDRGCDLGGRFSKACDDGQGGGLRRTASRRMAGHEPRRVPRQPPARQPLVRRYRASPRPAAKVSWISITACAARSMRINAEHAGKDVIAVGHGGTIKAAIGLALGGQPEKGLAFDIDNCSVTRLDHFASAGRNELAAADGQPAALDRGRRAHRDASAGRAGSRADQARVRLSFRERAPTRCAIATRNLEIPGPMLRIAPE